MLRWVPIVDTNIASLAVTKGTTRLTKGIIIVIVSIGIIVPRIIE